MLVLAVELLELMYNQNMDSLHIEVLLFNETFKFCATDRAEGLKMECFIRDEGD